MFQTRQISAPMLRTLRFLTHLIELLSNELQYFFFIFLVFFFISVFHNQDDLLNKNINYIQLYDYV